MTVCMALICHAIFVLGVTFAKEDSPMSRFSTMDIVLVQKKSSRDDNAKLLAQADMEGGGDTEEDITPSSPVPPPFPDNQPEVAAPPPSQQPEQQAAEAQPEIKTETPPASKTEVIAVTSDSSSNNKTVKEKPTPEKSVAEKTEQEASKAAQAKPRPSATSLLTNSMKIAALSARIDKQLVAKAERPKRKFISASTREYKYASYMEAWRSKVERVGNLNYPEEARKRKLSGSLVLDVALNPDGTINNITVRQPSGHKVLDDAAIRIVKLSAPFAPFPDAIHGETDILHIIRTWQFLKKGGFR